eukprot:scaffold114331_cov41-Prasinocladus_malaysianus.AAC.1
MLFIGLHNLIIRLTAGGSETACPDSIVIHVSAAFVSSMLPLRCFISVSHASCTATALLDVLCVIAAAQGQSQQYQSIIDTTS